MRAIEARLLLGQHISSVFEEKGQHLSRKLKEVIVSHIQSSGAATRPDQYRPDATLELAGPYNPEAWKTPLRGYCDSSSDGEWAKLSACLTTVFEVRRFRTILGDCSGLTLSFVRQKPVSLVAVDGLPWRQLFIPFDPPSIAVRPCMADTELS